MSTCGKMRQTKSTHILDFQNVKTCIKMRQHAGKCGKMRQHGGKCGNSRQVLLWVTAGGHKQCYVWPTSAQTRIVKQANMRFPRSQPQLLSPFFPQWVKPAWVSCPGSLRDACIGPVGYGLFELKLDCNAFR